MVSVAGLVAGEGGLFIGLKYLPLCFGLDLESTSKYMSMCSELGLVDDHCSAINAGVHHVSVSMLLSQIIN